MPALIDLTGQIFNRLTVIRRGKNNKCGRVCWICNCSCGTKNIKIQGVHLKSGHTKSCGCHKKEVHSTQNGMATTQEYASWYGMIDRCLNSNNDSYSNYGGRGITICNEWKGKEGFQTFYKDMGPKPGPEYSIDRININGPQL